MSFRPHPAMGAALVLAVCALFIPSQAKAQEAEYVARQAYFGINASCTTEASPDRAVIVGGVSSSAVKPSDAAEQLEKELGLMKSYVAEKHGELRLMERARTVKNPQNGRGDTEAPFQEVQRLQATFPANAPVDAILDKLIELGMDRFGDNVLNNYNRREAVVRYQISNFDDLMNNFEQTCASDAWTQWCAKGGNEKACTSKKPPANLELQGFTVRSKESLMRPDGMATPWQWNMSRAQRSPDPPDLLGNVAVHLEGFINLSYQAEAEKP